MSSCTTDTHRVLPPRLERQLVLLSIPSLFDATLHAPPQFTTCLLRLDYDALPSKRYDTIRHDFEPLLLGLQTLLVHFTVVPTTLIFCTILLPSPRGTTESSCCSAATMGTLEHTLRDTDAIFALFFFFFSFFSFGEASSSLASCYDMRIGYRGVEDNGWFDTVQKKKKLADLDRGMRHVQDVCQTRFILMEKMNSRQICLILLFFFVLLLSCKVGAIACTRRMCRCEYAREAIFAVP